MRDTSPTESPRRAAVAARRRGHVATALVLVDFLNFMDFGTARELAPHAIRAARKAAALKRRLARAHVPVIYANDNFGHWDSDIHAVVETCRARGGAARALVELLEPGERDRAVLKPRHSAFYGTPLEFVLDELGATRLVLAGLTADSCIMFTAHDAYVRGYDLWVPRDCVAAHRPQFARTSLAHMQRVLKAITLPGTTPLSRVWRRSGRG